VEPDLPHDELAELCADAVGRPAIEPEAAVRLMLAGSPIAVVHDRRLMREAPALRPARRRMSTRRRSAPPP
jgi:hypothetical protein